MKTIKGVVKKGLGIATMTIGLQKPIFFEKGLPMANKLNVGTINLELLSLTLIPNRYDFFFSNINWSPDFPIESFGFIKIVSIKHGNKEYSEPGYLYFPSKSPHVGNFSQVEIISIPIINLEYGDTLEITIKNESVIINPGSKLTGDDLLK